MMFRDHFGGFLNLARIRLVCHFITAASKVRTVNYSKLSAGFDTGADAQSNYRRIQRFMAGAQLPMEWVAKLIFALLPQKGPLVLVMDRIDCLLADREFVGEDWMDFLNRENIRYQIRIRNNFKVFCPRKQREIKAWHLFNDLKVGELRHYERIVRINGRLCYLSGTRTIKDGKMEHLILVSFNRPDRAVEQYRIRWQVETLFRRMKSSGFNIEDTHDVILERLEKLMLLVMIAFVWCYRIGDFIDSQIRAIKIKKHGRRAVSICKYGLDCLSRVLLTGRNELNINVVQFLSCT